MKKILTMTAVLALTAGMASAQDYTRMSLSYGTLDKNAIDIDGLSLNVEGDQNNFLYEGSFTDGDIAGTDYQTFDAKLGWHGWSVGGAGVGPIASYDSVKLGGGNWADDFAVGVMGKAAVGPVTFTGDIQSSTENFGDDWKTHLGAEYPLGNQLTLLGDYDYVDYGNKSYKLGLGARYDMNNSMFIEGGAIIERSFNDTGTGAQLGVGLKF